MKKLLFAFATLLFVACGNKVAQPELVEATPLPEYELLSTEEPRVSANGHISPQSQRTASNSYRIISSRKVKPTLME